MSEQISLKGKTALITGASAGIGRAITLWLAEHGADVALDYFSYEESAEKARDEIVAMGRKALLFRTDVSDESAVEKMVEECIDKFGHLDILVSCAVFSERGPFYEADTEGFRRTVDVTMWGAFNVMRSVSKHMIARQKGGNIVIISSPHSFLPIANCMAYNMAKAGLDQMSRTAALELIKHRIRVNLVHPGWTDTPGERKFMTEEQLAAGAKELPWGRLARPEEIARAVGFLLDDASDYITGSTLTIDAGSCLPWRDMRF